MTAASEIEQPSSKRGHGALYAGGIAAIIASTCHHISFLLVTLGLSNSRIVYIVTLADMARPFLIVVALVALFISYTGIWHISSTYKAGRNVTNLRVKLTDKVFFLFIALLVITVLILPYFLPCTE
jgi:mercuric ion transport protein